MRCRVCKTLRFRWKFIFHHGPICADPDECYHSWLANGCPEP